MSTKTTFKRVALVAVASLGIGVLSSVAPASATSGVTFGAGTGNQAQFVTGVSLAQATTSPTVGSAVVVNFGATIAVGDTATAATAASLTNRFVGAIVTHPGTSAVVTGSQIASGTTTACAGLATETSTAANNWVHVESATMARSLGTACSVTATSIVGIGSFSFTPTVAGVYVFRVYNQSADGANLGTFDDTEASNSINITVVAAAGYSAGLSTAVAANRAGDGFTTDSTTAELAAGKAVGNIAGIIKVTLKTSANASATGLSVTGSISGSGLILVDTSTADTAGSVRAGTSILGSTENVAFIHVSGDGSAGIGVVTITVTNSLGTTTLTTKSFTFFGTVSTFTRDAETGKTLIGAGESDTIDLLPVDSLGNVAAPMTGLVATSSNVLVATATANADNTISILGVASGTAVITACNVACATTGAISKTFTVTVTKKTAASFTMTFDKATYAPGEKMTLTVSAKDSNGAGVADSSNRQATPNVVHRALFSSAGLTANAALSGLPAASANVDLTNGSATFTMFAPLISGDVVLTATQGAAVDAVIAGGTGAAVTAPATVSGGSADAALDAANEATDAAYAAADAADNATQAAVDAGAAAAMAQESADAALAAVTDLGIKVTGLLDALSKSLANIYKIIKAIQAKQK